MKIINKLTEISKELGFLDFGFSGPVVDKINSKQLTENIQNGFNAEMKWIERNPEKRIDARNLLRNAKSVICFIHKVPIGDIKRPNSAKFAQGEDYHEVIKDKLNIIINNVLKIEFPDVYTKICVDTSPIFEKAFAVSAGLGWIGKHTLLIHPKFGSNIALGEIITNIPFCHSEQGEKSRFNQCGTCTKCIDACPTGALVKPYTLDARKCISYLTFEYKKDIPADLKGFCNNKHGCDICTDICPLNQKQHKIA